MIKKRNILITVLVILFSFLLSDVNAYADELTFAVAPSKIVNLVIEPNAKKTLNFKVANQSVFSSQQSSKNELYNFKILVDAKLYDTDGLELSTEGIVNFSKEVLNCKPNKTDSVEVVINIPKDFEKNSYRIDLLFTRTPIAGVEDLSNTNTISSIKVPVYLGVGNPDEYSKLKTDYEIEKFAINFGDNKDIFSYVKENLIKLITLNPKTIIDTFQSISEKDLYVVNKDKNVVVDVLTDIFTDLNNVLTYDNNKTKYKYVSLKEEDYTKTVKNIKFDDTSVKFYLENDYAIEIPCDNRVMNNLKTQINNLMKENTLVSPEFKFFAENLKVPKNMNYYIPKYSVDMILKNTGEKETFVTSSILLKKDSSSDVANAKLELVTLQKNNTEQISVDLNMTGEFSNGTYNLSGDFNDIKNVKKSANFKFDVNLNLDKQIYTITLIIYLLCISMIILVIFILIKSIKSKRDIVGYVITESIDYVDIIPNSENYELYKNVLNLNEIDDLNNYKVVNSIDVIVRDKSSNDRAKTIYVLHKGDLIYISKSEIEQNDICWIEIKFNKKMVKK